MLCLSLSGTACEPSMSLLMVHSSIKRTILLLLTVMYWLCCSGSLRPLCEWDLCLLSHTLIITVITICQIHLSDVFYNCGFIPFSTCCKSKCQVSLGAVPTAATPVQLCATLNCVTHSTLCEYKVPHNCQVFVFLVELTQKKIEVWWKQNRSESVEIRWSGDDLEIFKSAMTVWFSLLTGVKENFKWKNENSIELLEQLTILEVVVPT